MRNMLVGHCPQNPFIVRKRILDVVHKQLSAFVEVKVFGAIPEGCLDKLTGEICGIYEQELQIPQDHVYIKYEEVDKWGWNGNNFWVVSNNL